MIDKDKFWSRVAVSSDDACWPWTGSKVRGGYGGLVSKRKSFTAHRVAYFLTHGTIDASLDVLHSCDNPPCCNPAHLRQGTDKDNMRDMILRGRSRRGEQKPSAKLTDAKVSEIKAATHEPHIVLARKFGVRFQTIQAIRAGRTWSHVPGPIVPPKQVSPVLPRQCACGCGEVFRPHSNKQKYASDSHWRQSAKYLATLGAMKEATRARRAAVRVLPASWGRFQPAAVPSWTEREE
jgi:hypothetical protein